MWRRQWQPTAALSPGKSHGWGSLVSCSPWVRWELDTTEQLHFHFLLSYIGEGNGNPFQCSCLENPRDGGAWWAAICGVAQSRTRLKRLSSSSSSMYVCTCIYIHTYMHRDWSNNKAKNIYGRIYSALKHRNSLLRIYSLYFPFPNQWLFLLTAQLKSRLKHPPKCWPYSYQDSCQGEVGE